MEGKTMKYVYRIVLGMFLTIPAVASMSCENCGNVHHCEETLHDEDLYYWSIPFGGGNFTTYPLAPFFVRHNCDFYVGDVTIQVIPCDITPLPQTCANPRQDFEQCNQSYRL